MAARVRLYMLKSDLTSLDLPQFSQCMDANEESWHRLFFIYFFAFLHRVLFFLVDTAASTPQEKNWDRSPFAIFFSKEKRALLHRLSQNGNPYNILWSDRKKTESCQGEL